MLFIYGIGLDGGPNLIEHYREVGTKPPKIPYEVKLLHITNYQGGIGGNLCYAPPLWI